MNINERDKSEYLTGKSCLRNFLNIHKNFMEDMPKEYTSDRDMDEVLSYLGSTDGLSAFIKTPIEVVTFNEDNLYHLLFENESERLIKYLGAIKLTLQKPNLIIENNDGKIKHNYIKAFRDQPVNKAQLVIAKSTSDGVYYVTTFNLKDKKLYKELVSGEIIYDITDGQDVNITNESIKRQKLSVEDYEYGLLPDNIQNWLDATTQTFFKVQSILEKQGYTLNIYYPNNEVDTTYLYINTGQTVIKINRDILFYKSLPQIILNIEEQL